MVGMELVWTNEAGHKKLMLIIMRSRAEAIDAIPVAQSS